MILHPFEMADAFDEQNLAGEHAITDITLSITGSIGFCMQMFTANILGLYSRAESLENSLDSAKPA